MDASPLWLILEIIISLANLIRVGTPAGGDPIRVSIRLESSPPFPLFVLGGGESLQKGMRARREFSRADLSSLFA